MWGGGGNTKPAAGAAAAACLSHTPTSNAATAPGTRFRPCLLLARSSPSPPPSPPCRPCPCTSATASRACWRPLRRSWTRWRARSGSACTCWTRTRMVGGWLVAHRWMRKGLRPNGGVAGPGGTCTCAACAGQDLVKVCGCGQDGGVRRRPWGSRRPRWLAQEGMGCPGRGRKRSPGLAQTRAPVLRIPSRDGLSSARPSLPAPTPPPPPGVISVDEVQAAVSCLREQLSPEDLNTLLCKLGVAAKGHDIKVRACPWLHAGGRRPCCRAVAAEVLP